MEVKAWNAFKSEPLNLRIECANCAALAGEHGTIDGQCPHENKGRFFRPARAVNAQTAEHRGMLPTGAK